MRDLQSKVDRLALKTEEFTNPVYKVFDEEFLDFTKKPVVADLTTTSSGAASGPNGHGAAHDHRGLGHGVVTTLKPTPVKGPKPHSKTPPVPFSLNRVDEMPNWNTLLPQLDFPHFDGSSPKIWKKKCENFFRDLLCP